MNVNPSMEMGIIHSCFLFHRFWLLSLSGMLKMGYVLTANDNKAKYPLPPQDPLYSQMCFD